MKILSLNTCLYGSTGKIMWEISKLAEKEGHKTFLCYMDLPQNMQGNANDLVLKGSINRRINTLLEKITGLQGHFAFRNTKKLLKYIKNIKPDIIHIHNLHGLKINFKKIFNYIKQNNIKVIWTLHDCWAFTGQCSYFFLTNCDKWKNGCNKCQHYNDYKEFYLDRTKKMWLEKKQLFSGLNMTIVTPSSWLKGLVEQSFLKDYFVTVINNGIDLSVFKPMQNDFRKRLNLQNKFVVLGVAFDWGYRKGLDVFCKLANTLGQDYQIVLVGVNENQRIGLPKNILALGKTKGADELVKLYSIADVFVNATRDDNFPTVNIESLACGTPVITFKTGGSTEIIDDLSGVAVEVGDIEDLVSKIVNVCQESPYSSQNCINRAKLFNKDDKFKEYIELYKKVALE